MKKIKLLILIILITNAFNGYSQCALYTFKSTYNAVCANDQVTLTAIATQPNYGNGSDGSLTVSASTTVNTVQSAVTGLIGSAGSYSIAVANATGFAVGKEILIISMQDSTQSIANTVGLYEFKTITSISSNTITFSQPLTNTYLASTYFKHQVILVPNYTNVTVNSGGILTCTSWNGATGGVLIFRVSGNLIVNTGGIISASQKGYRGLGHPAIYRNYNGAQGEGIYGQGYIGAASSGANGYWNFPNGNGGGGATGTGDAGGGGGGSYGTLGTVGVNSGVHNKGLAGKLLGDSAVARLYFGGAGGEGGADEDGGAPGKGGNGGGIIYIGAGSITNNGAIVSNGEAGGNGGNTGGGGGGGMGGGAGGAGGTIQLGLNSFSGTGTNITVNGGALGTGNGGGNGGAGGKGRIRFDMTSTPPATTPPAFQGIPIPIAGVTYSWSTGATTNSIVVAPTSTSTYYVDVTSSGTCSGLTSSQTIIVNPQTATLTVNTPSVCAGFTSTLTASGGGLIPNSVSNLVAYYRFDEGSGTTANDLSGNVLTGTLVNTPVWSASTASILPSAGNTLTFNNSNTFVNITDAPIISTLQSSLTIEAWVYPTDNSNNTIIDRANDNFLFGTTFNGQSGIAFYNPATNWQYSTLAVPANQWSHVAMTWSYDGLYGRLTFYVNGVYSNQYVGTTNLTFGTGNMNIGRRQPTGCQCDYFNGKIDEVKVWNIPRTQAQIASQKNVSLSSYVWSGGITNGVPFIPTTSATFTVSNQFGCATPITVSVSAPPIVVSGTNAVCPGTPVTLTASGANTYTWSNGSNSTNITVTPTVTTTYTVSGTAPDGCFLPILKTVVVDVVPTINIINPGSIPNCSSTTLTASAPMLASGGVITYSNGYAIHTFKSSDVFKMPFTGPVEVMVVAGGGGGGNDMGGGGGAGGVVYSSALTVNTGSYNVVIGAGGAGAASGSSAGVAYFAANGVNSSFYGLTAIGGGRGASRHNGNNFPAAVGGSGGGASGGGVPAGGNGGANAAGTPGQGYAGGAGAGTWYPGGGGGAGGVGFNQPGDGGPGLRYLSLSPYYFAGGGGGAGHDGNSGNGGIGGGGGGGAWNSVVSTGGAGINNGLSGGAGSNQPGGNAGANTGGGGGGGSYNTNNKGGDGGSGIVIIKYLIPPSQTYSYIWSTGDTTSSIAVSPNVNTNYSVTLTNTTGCTANSSVITLSVTPLNISITNPGSIANCSSATLTANAYGNPVVLTYSTVGVSTFVAPAGLTSVEYLIVAGGGGGGNDMGGGGGGGGVLYGTTTVTPGQTYTINVGNGGNGAPAGPSAGVGNFGFNGGNSIFNGVTAIGGGYGASRHNGNDFPANIGGSGGGASGGGIPAGGNGGANASGISGQGNAGGLGAGTWYPGGGGGAGGVGLSQPANGGPGIRYVSMSPYYFGGGGGGAGHDGNSGNGGIGGGGGGGAWNSYVSSGGAGINNGLSGSGGSNAPGGNAGAATGGGGGGGSYNTNNKGGNGGSGIVILKYNQPAVNTWSYTWSNGGANSQSIIISPTVNTNYSVTLTNPNGCSASSSAITVSVNPLFIQINSPESIQNCNSATLSASAPIIGTGGNITTSGGYAIHTFTNVGASVFTPPAGVAVEYLVVAGGGGSGYSNGTGGGGGGGVLTGTTGILSSSAYTINVGAGGIGVNNGSSRGGNGSNSSAFTFTAIGGGGSGSEGSLGAGNSGGSGGGGVRGYTGGTGTPGQGFTGGSNVSDGAPHYSGGGGGGAGGAGTNGSASVVGVGGIGIQSSISGTAKYYGGGGGAGSYNNGSGQASSGAGGLGGGAMGGTSPSDGQNRNGLPNTGGGGAGYGIQNGLTCGNGGSGIVILRYLMPVPPSYSYAWSNGANTQTIVVSPSVTTTYSVVLTNTAGCVANSSPKTLSVTPLSIQITNPGSIPNCTSATLTATTPLLGTGGIITYTNGYAIHTFTSSGVFNLPSTVTATVLVVAGGGGGGMDMGGGGGGGGVVYSSSLTISAGTNSVVVGAGGTGAPAANTFGQPGGHNYTIPASNGQNSTFSGLMALGGGKGGSSRWNNGPGGPGSNGGSGGGASGYDSNSGQGAGLGTVGQGNNGGNAGGSYYSGGGGGAGSAGSGGTSLPHGGAGIQYPAISPFYFGGGGGGSGYSINGGNGGIGGGGGGAVGSTTGGVGFNNGSPGGGGTTNNQTNMPGGNAGANTGGGGGGGSHYNSNNKGGEGGSGIVIIKYLIPTSSVVYNYAWSTGDTTQSIVVSPNSTTSYSVVLTTTAGCVANSSPITLSVTPLNIQIINPGTIPNCSSATLTAITMGDPVIVTYTNTGASTFSVPAGITNVEYLIVAGGGGAGYANGTAGGGGGGVLTGSLTVIPGQTYPINVGVGGTGVNNGSSRGGNGGNSSAFSYTAIGGGGSGSEGGFGAGNAGGSGGGGVRGYTGGAGTSGQGFAGGSNVSDGAPHYSGGGGGGAGGAGTNGSASVVGVGGIGIQSSISGTAKYYGGGGGAGSYNNGSGQASSGAGGLGGGAMGGTSPSDGQNRNGLPNTGGGGAGYGIQNGLACGNGGSGIVIVKYYLPSTNVFNYSWSTGATTQSIVVSPNSNTSYSVVLSNTAGCVANSSPITLSVTPLNFQITSTPSVICAGSSATLTTASSGTATGGVVSYSGGYTIHTFTANSTFSVTGSLPIEYLIVGGGGGSGGFGGGGGGGGLLAGSTSIAPGSYPIVIGAGGNGETTNDGGGTNGGPSSAFTYTAIGGGYGRHSSLGTTGGSGGGNGYGTPTTGGSGTASQGNNGGFCPGAFGGGYPGAGGGGAGGVGGNTSAAGGGTGGDGGAGFLSSISGSAKYYAVGGPGASRAGGTQGNAAPGGSASGQVGAANTGNGAGGGNVTYWVGVNGGSGVVIVRYLTSAATSTANTFSWSTGATSNSVVITPSLTTTYSVTGTNSSGCIGTTVVKTVSVNPIPTVVVNSGTVCSGNTFSISVSGATTYTYSGGSAVVNPTVSTDYTVTGTGSNGCTDVEISSVTVNPKPTLTVNTGTICAGDSFTMVPSGASTYTYSGGSAVVSPTVTTDYTITGTSSLGCPSSNSVICTVNVSPAPILTISGSSSICAGSSATLSAGTSTFSSSAIGGVITYSAGYTIHTFNSSGTFSVTGNLPIQSLVVAGGGSGINNGGGGGGGGVVYKTSDVLLSGNYPITVGNGGAAGSNGQNSTFNGITAYGGGRGGPNASNGLSGGSGGGAGRDNTGLGGASIPGIGGGTYYGNAGGNGAATIWSGGGGGGGAGSPGGNALGGVQSAERGGAGGAGILNSISGTATYYAGGGGGGNEGNLNVAPGGIGGGGNGGSNFGGQNPVAGTPNTGGGGGGTRNGGTGAAGGSGIVIIRYLTASASTPASSYAWSTGASTSSIVVTPSVTTTYSVVGTSSIGCVGNPSVFTVTIVANPTVAVSNGTICNGNSFTLAPSGASSYSYSSGTAVVSPSVATDYTITGTTNGCSDAKISSVAVNSLPTITVNSGTLCASQSFTMVPNGALTYTFSGGSAIVSPSITTNYTLSGTNGLGCIGTIVNTLSVSPLPTLTISGSSSICAGSSATLSAGTSVSSGPSNAINFDGVDDYISIPSNTQLMLMTGWTLETWVKRSSAGAQHSLIEKYDWAGGAGSYLLRILPSGQVNAANILGTSADVITGTTIINPGTWYHVAATFDPVADVLKVYVNGILEGTNSAASLNPAPSSQSLKLGCYGNSPAGSWLNGSMDEVRIWNTIRTQPQIAASMSVTIPSSSSGLVAYYQFNESSGLTTSDNSLNTNSGTLTNGPTRQIPSTAPISNSGTSASSYAWSTGATTSSIVVAKCYNNVFGSWNFLCWMCWKSKSIFPYHGSQSNSCN